MSVALSSSAVTLCSVLASMRADKASGEMCYSYRTTAAIMTTVLGGFVCHHASRAAAVIWWQTTGQDTAQHERNMGHVHKDGNNCAAPLVSVMTMRL